MTVTFEGAGGLFTVLGKLIHACKTKLVAQGTTIPAEVEDFLEAFEALPDDPDYLAAINGVEPAANADRNSVAFLSAFARAAQALTLRIVRDDTPLASNTLQAAAAELIRQMIAEGETVEESIGAISVTPGGSNSGRCLLIASPTSGDGRNVEHALAEDLAVTISGQSLAIRGEAAAASPLSYLWPQGSGTNLSLPPVLAESSLVPVGGFDTDDTETDRPDGWIVEEGVPGTTIKLTTVEEQTIVVSGGPGSGFYTISYTNADGDVQTTAPLSYDATSSQVQAALRLLTGLSQVTVAQSGTSPNFTHTITFVGVAGNVAILSSSNTFDTGSIAHNQTVAGSAYAYRGRAVEMVGDGSTQHQYARRVAVQPATVYGVGVRAIVDVFPAAGLLKIELVDGSGTVIDDDQGVANELEIDPKSAGDLSTSEFTALGEFFRTPTILPPVVYLRVRASTAISNGSSVFLDDLAMIGARQLYTGGPFVAAFGEAKAGDVWTLAATNDRGGEFQEWFYRLGITQRGQLLPSAFGSSSGETIPDSLIG